MNIVKLCYFILLGLVITSNITAQDNIINLFDTTNSIILMEEPYVGMTLTVDRKKEPNALFLEYHASSYIQVGYQARYNGVFYNLPFTLLEGNDSSSQFRTIKVKMIQVIDKSFTSPEGFRVGNSLKEVKQKLGLKKIELFNCNECMVLPSGWVICFNRTIKDDETNSEEGLAASIVHFIKYK